MAPVATTHSAHHIKGRNKRCDRLTNPFAADHFGRSTVINYYKKEDE